MITVCGKGATLDELRTIEVLPPKNAGKRWRGIQHGEMVDTIKNDIIDRGWLIEDEKYTLAADGADCAGALQLKNVTNLVAPEGLELSLGFLNSNTRRKALQLTVGADVLCCTNGMCTGSILLSRVHDHTVNLSTEINDAIGRYSNEAKNIPKIVQNLRETEVSPEQASEILMEVGRARWGVGWATVGRVDAEYRNPTFAEHGRNTSWALLNAFTYAARPNIAPIHQMETFNKFRDLLPLSNN